MKIHPPKFREQIVAAAAAHMTERSKRYTSNGMPKHVPMAYLSMAEHLVSVAESTSQQMAAKCSGDAHTSLTWLCVMMGASFEKEVIRLQSRLAPGREL